MRRSLQLITLVLLTSCSLAGTTELARDRAQNVPPPSSSAISSAPVSLPTGGTLTLPQGWVAGDFARRSPGIWSAELGDFGTVDVSDLASWDPGVSVEAQNAFLALVEDLVAAQGLTQDAAAILASGTAAELVSMRPGDVHSPKILVHGDPNVVGIGYSSLWTVDRELFSPGYIALLYDRGTQRVVRIAWSFNPQEPLIKRANDTIAGAKEAERDAVKKSVEEEFARYLDETPRSRLSWGQTIQSVDDTLYGYIR